MKVKALRYKKEFNDFQEFVLIEEYGGEPMVFTSEIPKLYSDSVTLEGLIEYMESSDYYVGLDLDWNKVEFVEFDLIETGEVGANIRNKLGPFKNLVALLEEYFSSNEEEDKVILKDLIKRDLENTKICINYLASLL